MNDLRKARRLIKSAKHNGYTGHFTVLRDELLKDIQITTGRVIAENTMYIKVIEKLIDGLDICEDCEDCNECEHRELGKCKEFMLRFPSTQEAKATFGDVYGERVQQDE